MLPYIIEQLHERDIPVGITTNGTTAIELAERWPEQFAMINDWDVSLDSPFRVEHNKNRGAELYDVALQALDLCKQYHKTHAIIMCGMRWNTDRPHLDAFIELARTYDAELRINTLKPTEPHHFREVPSPEQYFEAFSYLLSKTTPAVLGESTLHGITSQASTGCPCGSASLRINSKTPQGTVPVSPCVYLHDFKVGDLLKEDLGSIVNSPQFVALRRRNEQLPSGCDKDCTYASACKGGCAARAYLMRGSLDQRDPYCPLEQQGLAKLTLPSIQHEGTRVHENYLCTWIGKPK